MKHLYRILRWDTDEVLVYKHYQTKRAADERVKRLLAQMPGATFTVEQSCPIRWPRQLMHEDIPESVKVYIR